MTLASTANGSETETVPKKQPSQAYLQPLLAVCEALASGQRTSHQSHVLGALAVPAGNEMAFTRKGKPVTCVVDACFVLADVDIMLEKLKLKCSSLRLLFFVKPLMLLCC